MTDGLRRFMAGRYGVDKLNNVILWTGVILMLLSIFIPVDAVDLVLTVLSYGCLILAMFRTFSRNTYKRYQENRKFLLLVDRIKDREHRYFECPRCRQLVRVKRGAGKIRITCPKCQEKFVKKT
ncbi:MAG: hypothetical protein IKC09_06675 [Oscillospiraceae bacterium]|nr:hypothetical protein [Oscillospiraceae bacterium]